MNQKTLIAIGAIFVVLCGLAAVALNYSDQQSSNNSNENAPAATAPTSAPDSPDTATDSDVRLTITFTDNGFDKDTYTVGRNQVILVKNSSSSTLEFSSADHPTHLDNSEMNMRELNPGEEGTFQVSKAGTYGFHDHIDASKTGTLIVTE